MRYMTKIPRIKSAVVRAGKLSAEFDDGTAVLIPIKMISPPTGKVDWSRIVLEFKGAHLSVPVANGDYPTHEVPWDVLKRVGDEVSKKAPRRRPSKVSAR